MLKFIDNLLNRVPMYRLMLYFLIVLLLTAVVFCFTGILPYGGLDLIYSILILTVVSLIVNKTFAWIFGVQTNGESDYITAWILALIITPGADWVFLVSAAAIAQASKYILVYKRKHIFNPAAIAVVITFFAMTQGASWWVGSIYLLPVVVVGGLLIARKLQRFDLVISFLVAVLATLAFVNRDTDIVLILRKTLLDSAILFFALVMLVEPQTSPPKKWSRMVYGALVGIIFGSSFSFGSVYTSPELALVLGNIFSFIVSPKGRLSMILKSKSEIATETQGFIFESKPKLNFQPGQYLEWTLTAKNTDIRGNRRYFTIASSPTENEIQLGVKFYDKPSTFKQRLHTLQIGEMVLAGQLSGEFTLPKDHSKKLVFIAGGIGITPFRSMIKYMIDKGEKRDAVLFYSASTESDFAYKDVLQSAQSVGVRVIFQTARLTREIIEKEVPDFKNRTFYISGPHGMVDAFENILKEMRIPRRQIKIDFFPGYV